METDKLIAIVASLLGAFWVLVQIVIHAKEKGMRTILISALLLCLFAVPVGWWAWHVQHANHLAATPAIVVSPPETPRSPALPATTATPVAPPSALGSFTVDVDRNLVGGVRRVVLNCAFVAPPQEGLLVTAYTITIVSRRKGATAAEEHSFDRVLPNAITIDAGATVQQAIEPDAEVGDRLLDYRRSPADSSVTLRWKGTSTSGRPSEILATNR